MSLLSMSLKTLRRSKYFQQLKKSVRKRRTLGKKKFHVTAPVSVSGITLVRFHTDNVTAAENVLVILQLHAQPAIFEGIQFLSGRQLPFMCYQII